MTHIQDSRHRNRSRFVAGVGLAFLAGALALTGCGGGGGGGGSGSGSSNVRVNTVAPATGPFIGGTELTIRGVNFKLDTPNTVKIGGLFATDVHVVDAATLTCKTPPGTPGATVDVVVTNDLGVGRLAGGYSYLLPPEATSDVDGDGLADLIVSAPSADGAGAVYVFLGTDDPGAFQNATVAAADVKLTGHHLGDLFGSCVCSGDVNGDGIDDVAVGAKLTDATGAADAGTVYVFYGPLGASPTLSAVAAQVKLTGETTTPAEHFGAALEIADLSGDGKADILVGAPLHDTTGAVDAGCIYLFRGGATLTSKSADLADLKFDGAEQSDRVGQQITCGDLNGDGARDLVVGCPNSDPYLPPLLSNAGQVFVLFGGPALQSGPVDVAGAAFHGVAIEDQFGSSVCVTDLNGDGLDDLAVGAPQNDSYDVDAGRVYVFLGASAFAGRSAAAADYHLSGLPTHNSFGRTLRAGDVDGDSLSDLLVGAPDADYLNDRNGRAYLFRGRTVLANRVAIEADAIFNGEASQLDGFGTALSLLDIDGDGFADVTCASTYHGSGAGRVYLWRGGTGTLAGAHLASNPDASWSGTQAGSQFGASIAAGQ